MHVARICFVPLLFFILNSYFEPDELLFGNDKSDLRLTTLQADTARLNGLIRMAKQYSGDKTTLPQAKQYMDEAFSLAKQKNIEIPYLLYWVQAEVQFRQKNMWGAFESMLKAYQIMEKTRFASPVTLADARHFLAQLMLETGQFSKSIELHNKNVLLAQSENLKPLLIKAYRGLANNYNAIGNLPEEKKYARLLLMTAMEEKNTDIMAQAYYRLGNIAMRGDSNFLSAIAFYRQSLGIRLRDGDTLRAGEVMRMIGWNFYLLKQMDSSLHYYFLSIPYSNPETNAKGLANSYGNIGTVYRDKKDFTKALEFYKKSIEFSLRSSDWFNLSWLYKDMSDMYKTRGELGEAYEYFVMHKQFSDSVKEWRYDLGLAEARTRYEADTREKKLEVLTLKLNQQRGYIWGFSGFLLLVTLIGILIFRQAKLSNQRRISEMNHKISEMTQANLRQQMNPHFIFNTLNSIQYYMYQHDKIATNNYLTKFSSLMRKILENSQHTAVAVKDELDALQLYLELETLRFKEKFDYHLHVDEEIDTLLYKIPTMLIQPYVENAICHGLMNKEDKGILKIDLLLEDDYILCRIEDNGIGREAAMALRDMKHDNHHSLGTRITESRLDLVSALYGNSMKVNYTDLKDTSGNPEGTLVEIFIPIMT